MVFLTTWKNQKIQDGAFKISSTHSYDVVDTSFDIINSCYGPERNHL